MDQLYVLFDEIGVPQQDRDARESKVRLLAEDNKVVVLARAIC